nr:MAG TPA: hypothetical protein [Caudoviricetes sp.]
MHLKNKADIMRGIYIPRLCLLLGSGIVITIPGNINNLTYKEDKMLSYSYWLNRLTGVNYKLTWLTQNGINQCIRIEAV